MTHQGHKGPSWFNYSFFTSLANKFVFVTLVALFSVQVWISYQKLSKRSVAYDQDVRSSMEQLYPSFTLCPEYDIDIRDKDAKRTLELIYNNKRSFVLNELSFLTHTVKLEDG